MGREYTRKGSGASAIAEILLGVYKDNMDYKTTYQRFLDAAEKRREQAKLLKKQGKTNAEIGRLLGVSRQRAQQMVDG